MGHLVEDSRHPCSGARSNMRVRVAFACLSPPCELHTRQVLVMVRRCFCCRRVVMAATRDSILAFSAPKRELTGLPESSSDLYS